MTRPLDGLGEMALVLGASSGKLGVDNFTLIGNKFFKQL